MASGKVVSAQKRTVLLFHPEPKNLDAMQRALADHLPQADFRLVHNLTRDAHEFAVRDAMDGHIDAAVVSGNNEAVRALVKDLIPFVGKDNVVVHTRPSRKLSKSAVDKLKKALGV
ncbi:TPA: hypothetical protein HA244_03710 [Candidatus Micrarchaeota archaeon]|nr:hypothetical protein [Candidatus Micrarchaeota archaeon]